MKDFIKWLRSMQTIFKGKPCDSAASKFEMVGLILYWDLRNIWEAIIAVHTSKVVIRTVRKKEVVESQKKCKIRSKVKL